MCAKKIARKLSVEQQLIIRINNPLLCSTHSCRRIIYLNSYWRKKTGTSSFIIILAYNLVHLEKHTTVLLSSLQILINFLVFLVHCFISILFITCLLWNLASFHFSLIIFIYFLSQGWYDIDRNWDGIVVDKIADEWWIKIYLENAFQGLKCCLKMLFLKLPILRGKLSASAGLTYRQNYRHVYGTLHHEPQSSVCSALCYRCVKHSVTYSFFFAITQYSVKQRIFIVETRKRIETMKKCPRNLRIFSTLFLFT